ncbi:hypothetical protein AB1N83_012014 [Pleurotus pulmonarius]
MRTKRMLTRRKEREWNSAEQNSETKGGEEKGASESTRRARPDNYQNCSLTQRRLALALSTTLVVRLDLPSFGLPELSTALEHSTRCSSGSNSRLSSRDVSSDVQSKSSVPCISPSLSFHGPDSLAGTDLVSPRSTSTSMPYLDP